MTIGKFGRFITDVSAMMGLDTNSHIVYPIMGGEGLPPLCGVQKLTMAYQFAPGLHRQLLSAHLQLKIALSQLSGSLWPQTHSSQGS